MYCDVTDWSCLSSPSTLLVTAKVPQAWTAAFHPSPTPVALRHSAAFASSLAYLCPAVSVSSRAHRLAAWPPRRDGRSRVVAIPICSPSVPLFRGSMPAKMSGRTGAEAPLEKTSRHVTESHAQSRVVRYKYRIYIAEARIDSDQWPRFARLRSPLGN